MATLSIKSIAASCLDRTAPLSVKRHVFGYAHWTAQSGPIGRTLHLKSHLERIRGPSINLSIFLVGHEPGYSGQFTQDDALEMQHAIDVMRELYAQVGLGVRKLYWWWISTAAAGGYTVVNDSGATDLTEDFSGTNDSIDVFFVTDVLGASGWSNRNGPCDKNVKGERTGAVLQLTTSDRFTGILLAHEVGHYLGLSHANNITNVMGHDDDSDGVGTINLQSVNLTTSQGNTMKSHCFIQPTH